MKLPAVTDKRASEERLRGILEATPDAMLVVHKGTIEFANSLLERMFGYAKGTLAGAPLEQLIPERLRQRHALQRIGYERLPKTRPMGVGLDLLGRKADGAEFFVEISLSPLVMDGEELVIAAVRDISARKRTENDLRTESADLRNQLAMTQRRQEAPSELEVYRVSFDKAAAAIVHYSPDGRITRVNEGFCKLLGYAQEELFQLTILKITYPDDVQLSNDLDLKVLAGVLDNYHMDKRLARKDGTVVWVRLAVSVQRFPTGQPDFLIGVAEDITQRRQTEDALRDAQLRLTLATEIARVGYVEMNLDSKWTYISPELKRQLGQEEAEMVNQFSDWSRRLHPEDSRRVTQAIRKLIAKPKGQMAMEYRLQHKDGRYRWFSGQGAALEDIPGHAYKLVITQIDVTARKEAEEALRESEQRLALALKASNTAVWEVDAATQKLCPAEDLLFSMLGYKSNDLPGMSDWLEIIHDDDRSRIVKMLEEAAQGSRDRYSGEEVRYRAKDGSWRWILCQMVVSARDAEGKASRMLGTHTDIQARKEAEEQARQASLHDPLTGLPNRALLSEYGSRLIAAAQRSHDRGALLFIDLDRFKPINDQYGHEVGDRVLRDVAMRLIDCTRHEDVVARVGGDEFVAMLGHLDGGLHRASIVAQHIVDSLSRPFQINGLDLLTSPSIGIANYPEHGDTLESLIHAADLAMYRVKGSGRGAYEFYTPELDERAAEVYSLEARIRNALKGNRLALHYQPVVDVKSGRLVGVEALVRLDDEGKVSGPASFIPIAESAGLIGAVGEWVAHEACRQHEAWRSEGISVAMSINVSPLQFRQRAFPERLGAIISRSGMDPNLLQVEVTESTLMDSVDEAVEILGKIKSLGVKVAIDDFGTGYSSLSRLSRLPLDKLKVDQSFVHGISTDPASRAVTEAIIALGRNLKLDVIGEGIESEADLSYLEQHGCAQGQGFLFSRPLPASEFARWYRDRPAH